VAAVEAREGVSYPRHHAAFCQTEEKSTCQKAPVVFNECGAHRDDSESNDEEWKVETSANNLQYDIRWDFDGDVGGVEDGKGPIKSESSQIEFLCHTLDTRVATSRQLYSEEVDVSVGVPYVGSVDSMSAFIISKHDSNAS